MNPPTRARLPREQRQQRILDVAAHLFYARGVHEVGMDELVAATGLGKATVYRLYPSKDALIGAYLERKSVSILAAIDADIAAHAGDPGAAIEAIFAAVEHDVAHDGFRGCAFNNASIEFSDPSHPARVASREYRAHLHQRLVGLASDLDGENATALGARLALVVDGMYTSAAHLGAAGPASEGVGLARELIDSAERP